MTPSVPSPPEREALAGMIDGRCGCKACVERTENIYRMVSRRCTNCRGGPFLLLYREGDPAAQQNCPVCGNYSTVRAERLATVDEIPATPDA